MHVVRGTSGGNVGVFYFNKEEKKGFETKGKTARTRRIRFKVDIAASHSVTLHQDSLRQLPCVWYIYIYVFVQHGYNN